MKDNSHRPVTKWPTGVEKQDDLIAHLRSENARLQDLVNRALSASVYWWRETRKLQQQIRKAS